eukprot:COSAG01_NODE_7160_length_3324_cov_192.600620_3_plen_50_part_00
MGHTQASTSIAGSLLQPPPQYLYGAVRWRRLEYYGSIFLLVDLPTVAHL